MTGTIWRPHPKAPARVEAYGARAREVSPNLDLRAAARLVAALRTPPALAVTDIVMPDLDGVELLKPLRGTGYRTDRPKRCSCC